MQAASEDQNTWAPAALAHMEGSSWVHQGDKKSLLADAIYFTFSIKVKPNVTAWSLTALNPSAVGIAAVPVMPALPTPACKDRPFAARSSLPRPGSAGTRLNYSEQEILRNPVSLVK